MRTSFARPNPNGRRSAEGRFPRQPPTPVLLMVEALGIACFALYRFVWAKNARY